MPAVRAGLFQTPAESQSRETLRDPGAAVNIRAWASRYRTRALLLLLQMLLICNWLCPSSYSQHFCFRALKDNVTHAHLQQIRRNLAHQQHNVTVRVICMEGPLASIVFSFNLCASRCVQTF